MATCFRWRRQRRQGQTRFFRPSGEALEPRTLLAAFAVNDVGALNDYDLNDGICSATYELVGPPDNLVLVPNNDCTLRAAIDNANQRIGSDIITFSLAAGSVIAVNEQLAITDTVTIDGSPGKAQLQGPNANTAGLRFEQGATGSTIRNLVLNGFQDAIWLSASGCLVVGSHIGVNLAGTAAVGNVVGIRVIGTNNTIGGTTPADRNIIAGNFDVGILIQGPAGTPQISQVIGNYIGTDVTGTLPLGNGIAKPGNAGQGVRIISGSGNLIGGSGASGNLISGNRIGVMIESGSNFVVGNRIGTDATGTVRLGNIEGVQVFGPNNVIGGDMPGGAVEIIGNLISGSLGDVPAGIFGAGVHIISATATGNLIQGNKIGTNLAGTGKIQNNSAGVEFNNGASSNLLGGTTAASRNIISGNDGDGVLIFSNGTGSNNNIVQGNYIGVDASGFIALGNKARGVHIDSNAAGNLIGGDSPEKRNVISGNLSDGVIIALAGATGNKVLGNFIGTDSDGTLDLGNTRHGVHILNASQNEIGGDEPTERNVISGNLLSGVRVFGTGSFGNRISGNLIGTTHTGDTPLGNVESGVLIEDARDNWVGVDLARPSLGNTISANTDGVLIKGLPAKGNVIAGNFIGTDFQGGPGLTPTTFPIGNLQNGVLIDGAPDNFIGPGLVPAAGCDEQVVNEINVISGNMKSGIEILGDAATGNNIRCNSIFANAALGIDLKADGVSANEPLDADEGPNRLQNFPVLSLVEQVEDTLRIGGTLSSKATTTYRIDFYATNVSQAEKFEHGLQGQRYLGTQTVQTDALGYVHFEKLLPQVEAHEVVTATATDLLGNTSEFGPTATDWRGKASFEVRTPVLVIPGIFGSFALDVPDLRGDDGNYRQWLLNVGIEPAKLQIDPLIHVYDDLITTLQTAGYERDQDLFVAPYDWRLNLAPITPDQGQHDGTVTGVSGASLTDATYEYGLDYLGYWLKQAAETYFAKHRQPLTNVNIVAHSMGGLLTRSYIQSTAYGDKFASAAAGRDLPLPVVGQFTMMGVPNQGGAGPWNGWHDNFIANNAYAYVLSKVINNAWQKLNRGATIQVGSDVTLTTATFAGFDPPQRQIEFVRRYSPGLGNLLPNYEGFALGFDPATYPAAKNLLLKDLNQQVFSGDRVARTIVVYGTSEETAAQVQQQTVSLPALVHENVILPFTDYFANDAIIGTTYWEDVALPGHGDGTVAIESLEGFFSGDDRVELFPLCQGACRPGDKLSRGSVAHTNIVSNVDAQDFVLRALGHRLETGRISTGSVTSGTNLLLPFRVYNQVADPVRDSFLVDSLGRRLGYSAATGQLTEIPGSFYFGNEDGIGWIFSDTPLQLRLELVGAGETHYVQASGYGPGYYFGVDSTGMLDDGEERSLAVTPTDPFPWHNHARPLDVSGSSFSQPDGGVFASDALSIINYINAFGIGPVPEDAFLGFPYGFIDSTKDNLVTARDALDVINAINAGLGGEGESPPDWGLSDYSGAVLPSDSASVAQRAANIEQLVVLLAADTVEQLAARRKRT